METSNNNTTSLNEKVSLVIPNDQAMSILSKLPVKSLKRFTCVQKSWSNLFENPHFMSLFRENLMSKIDDSCLLLLQQKSSTCQDHLFLLSGESYENKIKLAWPTPFQEGNGRISILGTCINGTICLTQGDKVVLWNPTTEEFKLIPHDFSNYPGLDFLITVTGFGYDDVTDDYKLIRDVIGFIDTFSCLDVSTHELARQYPDQDVINKGIWQIYSLKSNCWRKLDFTMRFIISEPIKPIVYLNGVCHWLGIDDYVDGIEESELLLQSFDMRDETFNTTSIYRCNFDHIVFGKLAILNGFIAWIKGVVENNCFDISILGEVGVKESWVKLFTIGHLPCVDRPIGIGNKGNIFFRKYDDELAWFDLRTEMIQDIGIKGASYCQIAVYKESFLFMSE